MLWLADGASTHLGLPKEEGKVTMQEHPCAFYQTPLGREVVAYGFSRTVEASLGFGKAERMSVLAA